MWGRTGRSSEIPQFRKEVFQVYLGVWKREKKETKGPKLSPGNLQVNRIVKGVKEDLKKAEQCRLPGGYKAWMDQHMLMPRDLCGL